MTPCGELVLCLGACHGICVKVLGEVADHIGLDVEVSTRETVMNGLDCQ